MIFDNFEKENKVILKFNNIGCNQLKIQWLHDKYTRLCSQPKKQKKEKKKNTGRNEWKFNKTIQTGGNTLEYEFDLPLELPSAEFK